MWACFPFFAVSGFRKIKLALVMWSAVKDIVANINPINNNQLWETLEQAWT